MEARQTDFSQMSLFQHMSQYIQKGEPQTGYYNTMSNTFAGVGEYITTVMNPRAGAAYISNLMRRQ
jgi:hypothetical protein